MSSLYVSKKNIYIYIYKYKYIYICIYIYLYIYIYIYPYTYTYTYTFTYTYCPHICICQYTWIYIYISLYHNVICLMQWNQSLPCYQCYPSPQHTRPAQWRTADHGQLVSARLDRSYVPQRKAIEAEPIGKTSCVNCVIPILISHGNNNSSTHQTKVSFACGRLLCIKWLKSLPYAERLLLWQQGHQLHVKSTKVSKKFNPLFNLLMPPTYWCSSSTAILLNCVHECLRKLIKQLRLWERPWVKKVKKCCTSTLPIFKPTDLQDSASFAASVSQSCLGLELPLRVSEHLEPLAIVLAATGSTALVPYCTDEVHSLHFQWSLWVSSHMHHAHKGAGTAWIFCSRISASSFLEVHSPHLLSHAQLELGPSILHAPAPAQWCPRAGWDHPLTLDSLDPAGLEALCISPFQPSKPHDLLPPLHLQLPNARWALLPAFEIPSHWPGVEHCGPPVAWHPPSPQQP